MKMYVFPRESGDPVLEIENERPWLSPAVDGVLLRLGTFLLAWAAGAGAAALMVISG